LIFILRFLAEKHSDSNVILNNKVHRYKAKTLSHATV